ncbi:molybdopterin-binding oxidoreductase, partial [bacterium]
VEGIAGEDGAKEFTLAQIKALPRVEMTTELCCIEGWSTVVHWTGARFADFMAKYPPITRDGDDPDVAKHPENLAKYVSLVTPDGGYFVGLDMQSALHPQTLLCYEMNGEPLTLEHGAPLRLVIPVKYGIKNIKRIGTITYTDDRPKDYWAEEGYDWYAGL